MGEITRRAVPDNPNNIKLIQISEGVVKIEGVLPAGATHFVLYVSAKKRRLGRIIGHFAPNQTFNVQKGKLFYVTVRGYNEGEGIESSNTDKHLLQMFERVCRGFHISHFFHEHDKLTVWAIGRRDIDNSVCILKSRNYFNNFTVHYSWAEGIIDNGEDLVFYIDKFGYMYVANRPSPLISRDRGRSWIPLPWQFQTPNKAGLRPFWNITEDEAKNLIVFSEYGYGADKEAGDPAADQFEPHHSIFLSSDRRREIWQQRKFDFAGKYRHIHGYHINPYPGFHHIHLLFLGDWPYDEPGSDGTPGLYVSLDSGQTWSPEMLHSVFGDQFNGPSSTTWWRDGESFMSNDSYAQNGYWWGLAPGRTSAADFDPEINQARDVDSRCGLGVVPWGAMAVEGGFETYCTNHHSGGYKDPITGEPKFDSASALWRYDQDTHKITVIALAFPPNQPFLYMSGSRGNVFPKQAKYVFNDGYGGIRIPRVTRTRVG